MTTMGWDVDPATITRILNPGMHLVYAMRPDGAWENISFYRGLPALIDSYTFSDPYSDATAQITFPQITDVDDVLDVWWCKEFTKIDICWAPASATATSGSDYPALNPNTNQPGWFINVDSRVTVWQGHTYAYRPSSEGTVIQCQGAMFALDRYISKPFYPMRPWPVERLIIDAFNNNPTHLSPFTVANIRWPAGWSKTYTTVGIDSSPLKFNTFSVWGLNVGEAWTGYATRNTGNWGRLLTGFISEMLGVMYTPDDAGVVEGNQWTILMDPLRTPYLTVRDRYRTPDFSYYCGTPGVTTSLYKDSLATSNIVYGSGTGTDAVVWNNSVVSNDGMYTSYEPLAYLPEHWPLLNNPLRPQGTISGETLVQFGAGIGGDQARTAADKILKRDADAGWVGDIEFMIDPDTISKWDIKVGMTIQILNFQGLSTLNVHIAQVNCSPNEGKVTCTVDSKYRDLLTLEEVTAKIRDPLTPAKLLKVGERTGLIPDHLAPWDYSAGSGIVPTEAKGFFAQLPNNVTFPWTEWTTRFPPSQYGEYYVKVNADKPGDGNRHRWNASPVITASLGTIRMSQFVCVDAEGAIVKIPFHISVHDVNDIVDHVLNENEEENDDLITTKSPLWGWFPYSPSGNYSPFADNNMWMRTMEDGTIPTWTHYVPPPSMKIGWGAKEQPAGYSPGRKSDGGLPTGLLVDESAWDFDNVDKSAQNVFSVSSNFGGTLAQTKLMVFFYAEHTEAVYFIGRFWRKEWA